MIDADPDDPKRRALAAYNSRTGDYLTQLNAALASAPRDSELLFADAAARAEHGLPAPFARLETALAARPDWVDGHYRLAQLRIEFGEDAPLAGMETVLTAQPNNPRLWHHYLLLLAAQGRYSEAALHAATLRRRIGNVPALCLLEARYAGLAGEAERAGRLLEGLPDDLPELGYQKVRNALQRGAADEAARLLGTMQINADIRLWALAELAWRATDDPRHRWLLPEGALLGSFDIQLNEIDFAQLCETLRMMHRSRNAPPFQSLRGGTQTRGQLHWRDAPALVPLFAAFRDRIASYVRALPGFDPAHPLARLVARPPAITASWSVRLTGGGFHIPHIHSEGLLSSACHLVVPDGVGADEGALELGCPPPDIALALAPIARFAAVPGRLVLFPSFLYHATTPFHEGERLTAVFDAA
jgi:hypothetical protein